MARIRTIKPEFWTDERLSECSLSAHLVLIASLTFADDNGNLDRSARQLKAQAFPYHHAFDVEPAIGELLQAGALIEYEAQNRKYLHINNFRKHQKINRPSPARFPLYDDSLRIQAPLTERSVSTHGSLTAGLEGKGIVSKTNPPTPLTLHDSLPVTEWDEWIAWRKSKRMPCDHLTLSKHLKILAALPRTAQIATLEKSIQANWQGLFPDAPKPNGAQSPAPAQRTGAQWAELLTAAQAEDFRKPHNLETPEQFADALKRYRNRLGPKLDTSAITAKLRGISP